MNDESKNGNRRKGSEFSYTGIASSANKHLWDLKFHVLYSLKWHAGLYRFWKFWEELAALLPVFLSLSVVGMLVDMVDKKVGIALAAVSSVLSLVSIAKGFGERAYFYDFQRKRYSAIFSKLERPGLNDEKINKLWDEFNDVETADWEEGLEAYGISCYNKTAIQLGVPDACKPLPWYRILTMCFF